jgi:putative oxidoreductase
MLQNTVALLARILLSFIFIASGLNHIWNWGGTIKLMTAKGMAMESALGSVGAVVVHFLLVLAVTFLLLGGLSILLGIRARAGAVLLVAFLIPATLIFHDFWVDKTQMINFMKNTSIMGGVLMVLAFGSGRFGVDSLLAKKRVELRDN